jgi:homogentisate phytyltransferase/homogentisate geranylgeranyltransferase
VETQLVEEQGKNRTPTRLRTLVEFSRPHTIIGTTLAVSVLFVLAANGAEHYDLHTLVLVLVASLSVNVYIVGLNQITDVAIDRINKPYLPLAAGTLEPSTAGMIVGATGAIALLVAQLQGRFLFATIATIFAIGTIYSLPPFRLKRFPFFAAASITVARAIVLNLGVYATYSMAFTGRAALPGHILLFVAFMFVFVIVIALMKDIPDVDGDRKNQIATLVIRLGAHKTLLLCRILLTLSYAGSIIAVLPGVEGVRLPALALAHAVAVAAVWIASARLDSNDPRAVYRYYMFIWKLFYCEFVAFPLACLLATR